MNVLSIDNSDLQVTPFFKFEEIENISKSRAAGHAVREIREVVEIRLAGNKGYIPVVPANSVWRVEDGESITYAERWKEQYLAFKQGSTQRANGTPLDALVAFGATPSDLSMCRALNIYSVEALHGLEGMDVKKLGMRANDLKDFARKHMAKAGHSETLLSEIEQLRAELAALKGSADPLLPKDEEVAQDNSAYDTLTDDELRDALEDQTGARPDGRWGRDKLINMLRSV